MLVVGTLILCSSSNLCYLADKGIPQSIRASFLGVGAPEAFVVAVVALLVFGPKGLAEASRPLIGCKILEINYGY